MTKTRAIAATLAAFVHHINLQHTADPVVVMVPNRLLDYMRRRKKGGATAANSEWVRKVAKALLKHYSIEACVPVLDSSKWTLHLSRSGVLGRHGESVKFIELDPQSPDARTAIHALNDWYDRGKKHRVATGDYLLGMVSNTDRVATLEEEEVV